MWGEGEEGVMGYVRSPPNPYAEVLTPGPQNVTLFGDGAFTEVMKVKGGPNPILIKEAVRAQTHRRRSTRGHGEKTAICEPRGETLSLPTPWW